MWDRSKDRWGMGWAEHSPPEHRFGRSRHMVGVPMTLGLSKEMSRILGVLLLVLWGPGARGGGDPDQQRTVPAGVRPYVEGAVETGNTYAGFLIGFPDRSELYLSPSRYLVSYGATPFECRNGDEYPLQEVTDSRWWNVQFEVVAVIETAIEHPPASGKWIWTERYDCLIKSLHPAS